MMTVQLDDIGEVLERARAAAIDYRRLTGKPLGITGEIGEYQAARLLGLQLAPAREAGWDASDDAGNRFQIKTRALDPHGRRKSQMVGSIQPDHAFDALVLIILSDQFEPVEIWRAERRDVDAALAVPGSTARAKRGALTVAKVKQIGRQVWPAADR